jgi:hypothetical protein
MAEADHRYREPPPLWQNPPIVATFSINPPAGGDQVIEEPTAPSARSRLAFLYAVPIAVLGG